MDHSPPSSSVHENFSAKNTGVGHHLLLQGIFWTQGSNSSLLHLPALADRLFTTSSTWGIPGTGEPGGLPSVGSHRVEHDWSDLAAAIWFQSVNYCTWSSSIAYLLISWQLEKGRSSYPRTTKSEFGEAQPGMFTFNSTLMWEKRSLMKREPEGESSLCAPSPN